MALFRIILIAFLVYLIIKFIVRLVFTWFYAKSLNNQGFTRDRNVNEKREEGDFIVGKDKKERNKIIDKDDGEYIDYEEIK